MYDLGDCFKIDYNKAKANPDYVFTGHKYRISILSERLIRFEWDEAGQFEDRPTLFAWNRFNPTIDAHLKEDDHTIIVTTKFFNLTYHKNKPFKGSFLNHASNLMVLSLTTENTWYYGHPEARNLNAPGDSFDYHDGHFKTMKGLYSIDGFVTFDDSHDSLIDEGGFVQKREVTDDHLDIYLFIYGVDFDKGLTDYFNLTGYPALIPRYALGNWWGKNYEYNDNELKQLVNEFIHKEIPLSIIYLNKDWHINHYDNKELMTGFTWNDTDFKAPTSMINYIHSKGIRVGLNINPLEGLYPFEEHYQEAKEYLKADANGIIPFNLLDPKTIDVYFKMMIHPLDAMGVDFFWLGIDQKKDEQALLLLDHYHFYDMTRNYKRRPMLLTRNPKVCPHRYPVLYSGKVDVSWDSLKDIMLSNAYAANMGVSWMAHDIGGFYNGIEDNELYLRFIQLGVFSSILKLNSDHSKYYMREPWRYSVKTYNIAKDYMQLRHRLIPYLYTEAYKYYKTGHPLMQPIYYKFPEMYDDTNHRNEYFLGSELFISPILSKKDYVMNRVVHKFFLPDGVWYDFVTGKKFLGNKAYVSFFRDQDYPVFAKQGAIIPLGENDNLNDTTPPKRMEIHIFPGANNTYKLYEDDGSSDLYKKGFYLLTSIDYNYLKDNYTVIIRALEGKSGIAPLKRDYKLRFRNTKEAKDVICYINNSPAPFTKYVEDNDFIVDLKDVPTTGQLTVSCKGQDIEIEPQILVTDDIESILCDLAITTAMKDKVDAILFSKMPIKKRRIAIRKLASQGLERKFIKLFLKLLEYLALASKEDNDNKGH